jgi:hypothetical protein
VTPDLTVIPVFILNVPALSLTTWPDGQLLIALWMADASLPPLEDNVAQMVVRVGISPATPALLQSTLRLWLIMAPVGGFDVHCPLLHVCPVAHVPQLPPHPLSPHVLPLQLAVHIVVHWPLVHVPLVHFVPVPVHVPQPLVDVIVVPQFIVFAAGHDADVLV